MNGHIDATRALLNLGAAPQAIGTDPLAGKTAWEVAPSTVRQAYSHELVRQVAIGDEGRVLELLQVRRKDHMRV